MELGKHLGKGLWGIADKALPVVYGLGYVWLVIRVLPAQEFANFVLFQEIFLVVTGLATAIALQPMVKYASEQAADTRSIAGAAFLLHALFLALAALLTLAVAGPLSRVLNAPGLDELLRFLPLLYAASLLRNFALSLLQADFRIREIFWIDAIHFLGVPFLVWIVSRLHQFDSAMDMVWINAATLSFSSLLSLWTMRGRVRRDRLPAAEEMRRLLAYGAFSAGNSGTYLIYSRADTFILSAFTGPVEVAIFTAAKVFTRVFEMVTQVVQMFVLPASSRLSSRGEHLQLKALAEKAVLFSTLLALPALLLFLAGPSILIDVLYGGRYAEAIPILRIFALLALVVPLLAVASSVLLGLGHARRSFTLGIEMLLLSCAAYAVFIPLFGGSGAAMAFVAATLIMAVRTTVALRGEVPIRAGEVLSRFRDIAAFIRGRFGVK